MIILTLRTDKPEAEIGIFENQKELAYVIWHAHRELAETIHTKIRDILDEQQLSLSQIEGFVVYKGPGSFTGLRIGITVANALADSLGVAIVAETGHDWIKEGSEKLAAGPSEGVVQPEYGAPPHITRQKR